MGLENLGFRHLLIVFAASIVAGIFVVLIDGTVIVPVERALLSGQTVTAA